MIDPQLMKPLDHFTGASFLKVTSIRFRLFLPGAIILQGIIHCDPTIIISLLPHLSGRLVLGISKGFHCGQPAYLKAGMVLKMLAD